MANIKKNDVASKKEVAVTSPIREEKNDEIELLKKQNESLQEQMRQMMEMFQKSMETVQETPAKVMAYEDENSLEDMEIPQAPEYNKQIKVMSLAFGSLNLSDGTTGKPKLSFKKFGEVKTVLYSTLIDIVNNNKSFADNGMFYILDKSAVYHLDLSEQYKNIIDKKTIDRIVDMEDWEILDITKDMLKTQKEMIVELIRDRAYRDSTLNLNKIALIGKECGHPEILKEINEMQKFKNLDRN